jgi:hypothetical protein
MVVWSGLGFLVAVITFGCCLLANFVLDAWLGEGFYSSHLWAVGSALFVGGTISSSVGLGIKGRSDRYAIDEETGERVIINRSSHTFFFVPMHWAGLIVAIIGVGVAISDAFN